MEWGNRCRRLEAPPAAGMGGNTEDDYLNKLAKSILSKPKAPPPDPRAAAAGGRPPTAVTGTQIPPSPSSPPSPPPSRMVSPPPAPLSGITPLGAAPLNDATPTGIRAHAGDWVRKVDFYDERGKFIPGTILVFEDGHMGVYKDFNPDKDYDIVYQLTETGRAIPHGMPLYNYEVEPVGRLSASCLEQLVASNTWDRDMIVFHLVKFKDRVHVPRITATEDAQRSSGSGDTFSSWAARKLAANELEEPAIAPSTGSAPALAKSEPLVRGRRLTISFGPNQRWEAVYWGKDELGHVVAHHTHERWALMHLDLGRFRETMVFGDIVGPDVLAQMEKDFQQR
jgi:hypothetical protein